MNKGEIFKRNIDNFIILYRKKYQKRGLRVYYSQTPVFTVLRSNIYRGYGKSLIITNPICCDIFARNINIVKFNPLIIHSRTFLIPNKVIIEENFIY